MKVTSKAQIVSLLDYNIQILFSRLNQLTVY